MEVLIDHNDDKFIYLHVYLTFALIGRLQGWIFFPTWGGGIFPFVQELFF